MGTNGDCQSGRSPRAHHTHRRTHPGNPTRCIASPGDQQLLVDIDLAILGAHPDRFDEYEKQVRAEYGWVPDFLFKPKRREILEVFLKREPIFGTPAMRERFEFQARQNLSRSLARL